MKKLVFRILSWCFPLRAVELGSPQGRTYSPFVILPIRTRRKSRKILIEDLPPLPGDLFMGTVLAFAILVLAVVMTGIFFR
ncbi:MAG: hypothetical protein HYV04_21360 [Deltaproteobacteria bacterium]|nr:hypothetical protein [Deltaproteobacteria bacterium]